MNRATDVNSPVQRSGRISFLMGHAAALLLVPCVLGGGYEAVREHRDAQFIASLAERVTLAAHAEGRRAQVLALRDFIRANVTFRGAPYTDEERPFLRATATETMQSGLGWCGEDTRLFINMAASLGIPAARINLYGPRPHVVALAELSPGEQVIVDAQNPPQVADLDTLDQAMTQHGYVDYSTLNLRRLHVGWLFSRVKLTIGPLTYLGENPHAIKAMLWFLLATAILALKWGRSLLRYALHRRGWIHVSSLGGEQAVAPRNSERL